MKPDYINNPGDCFTFAHPPKKRVGWLRRLVQALRDRKRRKLEKRIAKTKARIEMIEVGREVMRLWGDAAIKKGATFIVELLMERMDSERWEYDYLLRKLEADQKRLNDKLNDRI